jgi:HD-GYP domain-containing protein (c-di-GMP phosphodiesterase class II)/DNA-binding CsgD family transcriptional regulator
MGHVLRTTRIAMALADRLGVPSSQLDDVYFTALLLHASCTAGSADFAAFLASDEISAQHDFFLCDPNNQAQLFGWLRRNVASGQPLPARTLRMLRLMSRGEAAFQEVDRGCSDVGSRIAARLGLSEATQLSLYHICETWNGKGPHRISGLEIPLSGRIVNVSMILEIFFSDRGVAAARQAAAVRSGKSFDPGIAGAAIALCDDAAFWEQLGAEEPWGSVLELEPPPLQHVDEAGLDDFAYALADIVDLKSTAAATHSRRTAEVAEAIAMRLRLTPEDVALIRRAALVHDVGLVTVPSFLLQDKASWGEADHERFRLHPYYTERILSHSEALKAIGAVASAHHENIDGSGYHRGLSGSQLSPPARVVAAASAYIESMETVGNDPELALQALKTRRVLDPDCLAALAAEVAGQEQAAPAKKTWPAGLTEREVEVLRLVASGLNLKEAAERLVISDHTARHHLESVYGKAGVSSRAGITLFAVENGLLSPQSL